MRAPDAFGQELQPFRMPKATITGAWPRLDSVYPRGAGNSPRAGCDGGFIDNGH